MFGWRRRNDGFEWRGYVRTTILVRRGQRRQRIDEAKGAAREGMQHAGRRSAELGRSGAHAFGRLLASGARAAARAPHWLAMRAGPLAAPLAAPIQARLTRLPEVLRHPSVNRPLLFVGAIAGLGGLIRIAGAGLQAKALIALAIGALALLLALWPRWAAGERPRVWPHLERLGAWLTRAPGVDRLSPGLVAGIIAVATVSLAATGGVVAIRSAADMAGIVDLPLVGAPSIVEGRAVAIAGDTLRVGGRLVRLAGIEAPERSQQCVRAGGKRWPCGVSAAQALSRLVRSRPVTCEVAGSETEAGRSQAACRVGATDLAAELVGKGHVFASQGSTTYAVLESKAREARTGIWRGPVERPAEFRAKRWEAAKRAAPEGCPIKGSLTAEGRVYVLPWSREYERVRMRGGKGERWFCSEAEAEAAGWKRLERS
jgi:endonuclease YncB( thermonuclease family)